VKPAESVQSAQNARLKALRALRAGKEKEWTALEGKHLLQEALDAEADIAWILVDEDSQEAASSLLARAATTGTEILDCSASLLREASGLDSPNGLVAWVRRPQADWHTLLQNAKAGDWFLIAAGVQDPINLGALARVAAGFGACALLCLKGGGSPWHPRALRGASGTTFRLPVAEGLLADELLGQLHAEGIQTWATAADGEDLSAVVQSGPRAHPIALFLGEEGRGLAPELLASCQRRVGIPLARGVESLNVATAAAVVAWALCKEQTAAWGHHA